MNRQNCKYKQEYFGLPLGNFQPLKLWQRSECCTTFRAGLRVCKRSEHVKGAYHFAGGIIVTTSTNPVSEEAI